jgi:hypothetical protein
MAIMAVRVQVPPSVQMRKSQIERSGFFVFPITLKLATVSKRKNKNGDTKWIGFFSDNVVAGLSAFGGNSRKDFASFIFGFWKEIKKLPRSG